MEAKKHDCAQGEEIQNSQYGSNQCWWVIEFSPNFQSSYQLGYYTGQYNISYIIFKNAENFKNHFLQITKYCEEYFICWNENFKIN